MDGLDFLKKEDVKTFIRAHIHDDVNKLILNPPMEYKSQIKLIADQILSRQKAKGKLNTWATNFDLVMPPPLSIEQASSEATGKYKASLINGESLFDLTGGMGIDCLYLSENFKQVTYVERQSNLCEVFRCNSTVLKKEIEVINAQAEDLLKSFKSRPGNFFYLDPARRDDHKNRVFYLEDCTPDITQLLPLLKEQGEGALIKLSPILDLTKAIQSVEGLKEVHIVSVKNEVKEILLLIDFKDRNEPEIKCINLESGQPNYSYKPSEEHISNTQYGELDQFLYEPNSSVMKAGAFKKIGKDFLLQKLAANTHLYTSKVVKEGFPGRVSKVISEADKKSIKKLVPNGKINVISRNYPLGANELKKQYKLKDGGHEFLIAYRDQNNKPKMIIAQKIVPQEELL